MLAFAAAAFAEDGFQPLFNGKNLDGWDGDPRLWTVRDGIIVGSTEGVSLEHNEFLISKQTYRNFILRARYEAAQSQQRHPVSQRGAARVGGARLSGRRRADNNYWGCIYEEKGKRGMMVNGWKDKGKTVVHLKDWNTYEILCDGDHIRSKLNGMVTADLHDSARLDGIIALQLHDGPPMEAYFRNMRIKVLK